MQKLKEGKDPFRQVFLVGDKILKIQEISDAPILKYAARYPSQFAQCLQSWEQNGMFYYLYEKLDYVVSDMKLSRKQLYSMLCQVALILRQLRNNDWVWWDLHDGNIGAVKHRGNVVIDGISVPSYGYRFKILDFGDFIHKSNKNKEKRQDYILFSNVEYLGADLWQYLVPNIFQHIAHETVKDREQLKLFAVKMNVVKTAVLMALHGKKINVPIDDILFLAVHGLLSDESVAYMKKKL